MANVKDTTVTESTDTAEAPKAAGRPSTRVPGGRQIGAYFAPDVANHIREARFVKRLDKDSDVIAAAVAEYLKDIPAPAAE